ncbi:ribonuclease H-like domain-containing protein, partial [Tanacetum coccineum]
MHDPRDPHFTALKRILCYVRGTLDYGLQLHVTLSRSSAEAEHRGVANVVAETAWIHSVVLCLQIWFNINARNTLRSTFILFVTLLLRGKFGFFMSLQDSSMQ